MNPYKIDKEGKGRTATVMGNCPVFVLPSALLPALLIARFLVHTAFAALPLP